MITYHTIRQASKGDILASQEVLQHFDAYINTLCTHLFLYENGRREYTVDTIMKSHLQGKLLEAVIKFKL